MPRLVMRWLSLYFAEWRAAVGARAPIRINLLSASRTFQRFEIHAAVRTKSKTLSQREVTVSALPSAGGRHRVGLRRRRGLGGGLVSLVVHRRMH